MHALGIEWGEDYRRVAGDALKTILAARMDAAIETRNPAKTRLGPPPLSRLDYARLHCHRMEQTRVLV